MSFTLLLVLWIIAWTIGGGYVFMRFSAINKEEVTNGRITPKLVGMFLLHIVLDGPFVWLKFVLAVITAIYYWLSGALKDDNS